MAAHKHRPKRTEPRNVLGDISASLVGALTMLGAAEKQLLIFRTTYPEIKSQALNRLDIALDVIRRSLEQAYDTNFIASRELRYAAKQAGHLSAQARGAKTRKLIAGIAKQLLKANVPRRQWIDMISPRLPKRHRLGDAAIQKHLRALGFPGRAKKT